MRYSIFIGFILIAIVKAQTASTAAPKRLQYKAVDFSQPITDPQLQCMFVDHTTQMFVRAYASTNGGMFDQNSCNTIKIARDKYVVTYPYMIPSPKGSKSGRDQYMEMYNGLSNCNILPYVFFISVVSPKDWYSNPADNVKFIKDIAAANNEKNVILGVFTNRDDWMAITNNLNFQDLHPDAQLWWANAANSTGANPFVVKNFEPFGGWTMNNIFAVQYDQKQTYCGVSCNLDKMAS